MGDTVILCLDCAERHGVDPLVWTLPLGYRAVCDGCGVEDRCMDVEVAWAEQ